MEYAGTKRVIINYELPLGEILLDFFDQLKSRTRGYASFDYEFVGYRPGDLVKVNMLVNGDPVDALSFITPRERAYRRGAAMAKKLKEVIPAPADRNPHPGGHRRQDHRRRVGTPLPQGRHRQVLRRRHHPQAQVAGKAEAPARNA